MRTPGRILKGERLAAATRGCWRGARRIAYHEAGHTVGAIILRVPVDRVFLEWGPGDELIGGATRGRGANGKTKRVIDAMGGIAEGLADGGTDPRASDDDRRDYSTGHWLQVRREARQLITGHEPAIRAVAELSLTEGEIDGATAMRVVRTSQSMRPLRAGWR